MKTYGSIRRTDCTEAQIVLASGVYLTFRLAADRNTLQSLIEVDRRRMHMRPRESILVDARLLTEARRAAFDAILKHRAAMRLRTVKEKFGSRPYQLSFQM